MPYRPRAVVLACTLAAALAAAASPSPGGIAAAQAPVVPLPGAGPVDRRDLATEIRRAEATRLRALLAADVPALDALFADGLEYGHANGVVESKAALLERLANGSLRYESLVGRSLAVRPLGDTMLASGLQDIRARGPAGAVDATLRFLAVYARGADGRWRLEAYQSVVVPRPAG